MDIIKYTIFIFNQIIDISPMCLASYDDRFLAIIESIIASIRAGEVGETIFHVDTPHEK
jgi:hypothetical protein